jgi:hypothetical protein
LCACYAAQGGGCVEAGGGGGGGGGGCLFQRLGNVIVGHPFLFTFLPFLEDVISITM